MQRNDIDVSFIWQIVCLFQPFIPVAFVLLHRRCAKFSTYDQIGKHVLLLIIAPRTVGFQISKFIHFGKYTILRTGLKQEENCDK